jgi:hypothetical protein
MLGELPASKPATERHVDISLPRRQGGAIDGLALEVEELVERESGNVLYKPVKSIELGGS